MKLTDQQHRLLDEVDDAAEAVEGTEAKLADELATLHKKVKAAAKARVPRTSLAQTARKSRRWLYNLLDA